MEVIEEEDTDGRHVLNYTHRIKSGVSRVQNYGDHSNQPINDSVNSLASFWLAVRYETSSTGCSARAGDLTSPAVGRRLQMSKSGDFFNANSLTDSIRYQPVLSFLRWIGYWLALRTFSASEVGVFFFCIQVRQI